MRVERPRGHASTIQGLWRAAQAGRLPHALLLEGPSGVGRFVAATWLAQGLLCAGGPGEPCGECGPCKRVSSGDWRGNHPDLYRIDPVEEDTERIKIDRIAVREGEDESAAAFLSLRAMEGGWRIVLVRESHRMTIAAQNALLKTLEEPTPGTLLVLETHRPEALLQTIRSRCIRVRFDRLEAADATAVLVENGLEAEEAARLARWCGGSPGDALDFSRRGGAELVAVLGDVLRGLRPPLGAAREILELDGSFRGGTPAAKERDRARTVLDLGLDLVGDVMRSRAGIPPADLAHGELARTVSPERSARYGAQSAEALLEARADIERNLAPHPVLERALLVLAGGDGVPSPRRG